MTNITITISLPAEAETATVSAAGIAGGTPPMALEELQAASTTVTTSAPPAPSPLEEMAMLGAEDAPSPLPLEQLDAAITGAGEPPGPELEPEENGPETEIALPTQPRRGRRPKK